MRFLSKSLSVAVVAAMSVPSLAQQTMEEVVVTATKRAESIQDVPLSVSVVTGEVIERAEVRDLLDLQSVVPSLRVPQFQNSIQTNFVIRGFGNGANNPRHRALGSRFCRWCLPIAITSQNLRSTQYSTD